MIESNSVEATDNYRLDGLVAVVTGASGGIGGAVVRRLSALGAKVAMLDLQVKAESLAIAEALPYGGIALACDVSDAASVANAAHQINDAFGQCDILVNNAGLLAPPRSLEVLTVEEWDTTLAVNLRGVFLCTQSFGASMLKQGHGVVINIGSVAASSPNASPPYSVSKAGVLAFTRHTAVEWGPRGIRANSVSPGFIRTPLSESHYAGTDLLAVRTGMVPQRRLGLESDVADAVAFLGSSAAGFVNGEDLVVDGGFLRTTLMHAQPRSDQYGGRL